MTTVQIPIESWTGNKHGRTSREPQIVKTSCIITDYDHMEFTLQNLDSVKCINVK